MRCLVYLVTLVLKVPQAEGLIPSSLSDGVCEVVAGELLLEDFTKAAQIPWICENRLAIVYFVTTAVRTPS